MSNIAQYNGNGNGVAMAANPFATSAVATRHASNAQGDSGQQREIAEVQAAVVMARRFPRDQINAMERILNACTRPSLAESALYSYNRGGSNITGPSIRLAEVIAQSWGNLQYGLREIEQRNGESTVEAFAWDMETNNRKVLVFQVPHIRYTKKGITNLADPRDIYELVANNGARRLRNCILAIVPGDVIEAAVNQCEETLRATADTSPEALKKVLAAFEKFGVTQGQIEKRIQCRLEAIKPAQVVMLRKIYTSLKDGMSNAEDWFESVAAAPIAQEPGQSKTEGIKAKLSKKKQAPEPTPEPELDETLPFHVSPEPAEPQPVSADNELIDALRSARSSLVATAETLGMDYGALQAFAQEQLMREIETLSVDQLAYLEGKLSIETLLN